MKYSKGFKQLISRSLIFLAVYYILFNHVLGFIAKLLGVSKQIQIIDNLYIFSFFTLLLISYIYMHRSTLKQLQEFNSKLNPIWYLLSIAFIGIYFYFTYLSIFNLPEIILVLLKQLLVFFTGLTLFIAILQYELIEYLYTGYKKSTQLLVFFTFLFFSLSLLLRKLPLLLNAITKTTYYILKLIDVNTVILLRELPVINFRGFAVTIEKACSGIESIILFSLLFLFVLNLDWKKLNKKNFIILYLVGIVGLFFINIFRIVLLVWIGSNNPELAINLFHSNAGWILFVSYFLVYMKLTYKHLLQT